MGKKLATWGVLLGIVGMVMSVMGLFAFTILTFLGFPVAILGLVLSVVGGKKLKANGESSGTAAAGLVIGIISVVVTGIMFFACGLCMACLNEAGKTVNGLF